MKCIRPSIRRISYINRNYKKCVIPQMSGPVLLVYGHLNQDYNAEIIGEICSTTHSVISYMLFYVDNYLHQLENWRVQEASYEQKSEPPEWNTTVILNKDVYNIKLMQLGSAISGDISLPILMVLFQIIALVLSKFDIELTTEMFLTLFISLF